MALLSPAETQVGPSAVLSVPATLVRGGTSKCWIFRAEDLPADAGEAERLLIRTFGSPDLRQIDGVGGASSTTSKAIVVDGTDASGTVHYRFAQIGIEEAAVEWASNCGNCATALGLYAIHSGLVQASAEVTRVPILNTVTGLRLVCEIPTPDARVPLYGGRRLDGQHYPGVPVDVIFQKGSWSSYGQEYPTGSAIDEIELDGHRYPATLIDAGAPAALFDARSLGLTANEDAAELGSLVQLAPRLRAAAARKMNLPAGLSSVPKVGIVGAPPHGSTGVAARMISMSALHPAIGLTSAVAIAAASGAAGSVVSQRAIGNGGDPSLMIHLLKGTAAVALDALAPSEVSFKRSARVISEGTILVPRD
ncbi:4-oxalomesaconate tautomerase [Sinomonas notoginsengisoli]|uniref:PrpF domain-containing protein n=1 Tax=Sinomonas notoginsengisoli TaxID=1457311 RepID=UPI001F20A4AE|nr:PrpF domain-containing protein [Sinomonas notoginsengisoli]